MLHRPFSSLLALVGVGAVALAWGLVGRTLSQAKPVAAASSAHSIAWGDRVFVDAAAMRHWLRSRGASYATWASFHPRDLAILEGRAWPPR